MRDCITICEPKGKEEEGVQEKRIGVLNQGKDWFSFSERWGSKS